MGGGWMDVGVETLPSSLLPPYLIGQSKGSPVNGHRLLRLKVLVDLNSLFWVDVLTLHHIPGRKRDSLPPAFGSGAQQGGSCVQNLGVYAPMGIAARSKGPNLRPISWKPGQ